MANSARPKPTVTAARVCQSHFGLTRRAAHAPGIAVCETAYGPDACIPAHCHDGVQVSLVLAGGYEEACGRTRIHCEAATVVFHGPGQVHADRFDPSGASCLNVWVDPAALPVELGERLVSSGRGVSRRAAPTAGAFGLAQELRNSDHLSPLVPAEIVATLLDDLLQRPGVVTAGAPPRWLERLRVRLHDEFAAPPTLAELARHESVHPVHVARAFARHYGCTAGDYVRQRRVEFAARALAHSDDPIAAIAHGAGFADQSHCTRVFRRFTGATPAAFRRQSRHHPGADQG